VTIKLTEGRMAISISLGCLVLLLPAGHGQEKPRPSAEQALQRLKEGNDRFVADKPQKKDVGPSRRQELAKGQRPFAVILACADSRVPPEHVFNQGLGDLFVLRVAGNISDPFVIGSIEYAVDHLDTPLIVVLGHSECGAVKAALGPERPPGNLGKLIAEIDVGKDLPAGRETALTAAVKNNSRRHAELITSRSEAIKKQVDARKVRIVSGVYDLVTGKVEWLAAP
jgi:carbonic anhydrase